MKKVLTILVVVLVLICGVGGYMARKQAAQKEADKPKAAETAKVSRGDLIVKVVDSGTIDANHTVEVKSRVTGRIKALYVEEGDFVKAGQLVATIDPKETQLQLDQTQAQLRGAKYGVERATLEIAQRDKQNRSSYDQAKLKIAQLGLEMRAQPKLTAAAITEAETALSSAQSERQRSVGSLFPNQRAQAKSNVAEAEVNYETAKKEFDRQVELEAKGYTAGRSVESAKQSVDLAKVRLDQARDNANRLESQLKDEGAKLDQGIKQATAALDRAHINSIQDEVKRQDYRLAVADLRRAEAALQDTAILTKTRSQSQASIDQLQSVVSDSQRQLGETEIRAPISGVVTKRTLQVGELATGLSQFSSGSTIVKIEDRNAMRVRLDVNEIDVARMHIGMDSRVDVDALPGHTYTGKVLKIAPASKDVGNATGTQAAVSSDSVVKFEVEILLDGTDKNLRSGMSSKVTLILSESKNTLVLPVEFVTKENGKAYIEFPPATALTEPKRKEVQVGLVSGSQIEIKSGVKEGDTVHLPPFNGPKRKGFMEAGGDGS